MNQTGRRIAALAASLLFAVSAAGLLFSAAFADEFPEESELTAVQASDDPDEGEGSAPETGESGPVTDPEIPPTEGEEGEGTTAEGEGTEPDETTSETLGTGTEDPATDEEGTGPFTDPTTDEPGTGDPTVTEPPETTMPEASSSVTTTTAAPSRDPEIATGQAMSQGPISLSTEKGARPAESDGSRGEDSPGGQSGVVRGTDDPQEENESPFGEEDGADTESGRSGIRQISIICSVFALFSGAVLVLLKFIR